MNLMLEYPEYHNFFIRVKEDASYDVGQDVRLVGCGEYPESSVLAGQYRETDLDYFRTLAEAEAQYPELEVILGGCAVRATVPDVPWDGFDPADCGEVWSEEDY